MTYVDEIRTMRVRTNADTPTDAQMAVDLGAEGIGLCRTEHMFFGGQRIISVRKMILADNTIDREKALSELLPMQRVDFEEIFAVMNGMPVTVRLDPPLHEFLPNDHTSRHEMALQLGVSVEGLPKRLHNSTSSTPCWASEGVA